MTELHYDYVAERSARNSLMLASTGIIPRSDDAKTFIDRVKKLQAEYRTAQAILTARERAARLEHCHHDFLAIHKDVSQAIDLFNGSCKALADNKAKGEKLHDRADNALSWWIVTMVVSWVADAIIARNFSVQAGTMGFAAINGMAGLNIKINHALRSEGEKTKNDSHKALVVAQQSLSFETAKMQYLLAATRGILRPNLAVCTQNPEKPSTGATPPALRLISNG